MRIALIAGESSGDLLGAGLINSLRSRVTDIHFEGVAGPAMQAAGCEVLEPAESLAVFGLIEPLARLPYLLRLRSSLLTRWTDNPPDVFVGIDAPDFNLGLELKLRARGVKTVHYVSPSVWVWRQGRVRKVEKAVDKVLCLLPFEKSFYDKHNVDAEFVGHPLADNTPTDLDTAAERRKLNIVGKQVVAVLPGSRHSEVSRLGPVFAQACALLSAARPELRFVAPMVSEKLRKIFAKDLAVAGVEDRFLLTDGNAQSAIAASDVVLLASGTASLQAALLGKPVIAAYRFGSLTYAIAKTFRLVKVSHFALPNFLTEEPLVPEFLQDAAKPQALSAAVGEMLDNPDKKDAICRQFGQLRIDLAKGANERAAAAVLELAGRS
ncbi:MAG: lipid-A-disaccharide synthase [Woeseiaceae bacterium]|jgi:lipid-A-disaccharide synthase